MGGKKSFPGEGNGGGARAPWLKPAFLSFGVGGNGQHLVVARNQHGMWGGVMKMKVEGLVGQSL